MIDRQIAAVQILRRVDPKFRKQTDKPQKVQTDLTVSRLPGDHVAAPPALGRS